jgi:hypothetical protein
VLLGTLQGLAPSIAAPLKTPSPRVVSHSFMPAPQRASVRLELLSSARNAGRAAISAAGMTAVLLAAAAAPGGASSGDLVSWLPARGAGPGLGLCLSSGLHLCNPKNTK